MRVTGTPQRWAVGLRGSDPKGRSAQERRRSPGIRAAPGYPCSLGTGSTGVGAAARIDDPRCRARDHAACSSASSTSPRGVTRPFNRLPRPRAGGPSSTSTPTSTTTAACSPSSAKTRNGRSRGPRWRRWTSAPTKACTPVSASSTWCRSCPLVGDDALPPRSCNGSPRGRPDELGVPTFLYGPERSLPEVRRGGAFTTLRPDHGPATPHPTVGAIAARGHGPCWWRTTCGSPRPTWRSPAASLPPSEARRSGGRRAASGRPRPGVAQPDRPGDDPGPAAGYDLVDRAARTAAAVVGAELVGRSPRRCCGPARRGAVGRARPGGRAHHRGPPGGRAGGEPPRGSGDLTGDDALGERPRRRNPAPLTLAHAAPDAELLAVGERGLQAVLADDAAPAHLLGLAPWTPPARERTDRGRRRGRWALDAEPSPSSPSAIPAQAQPRRRNPLPLRHGGAHLFPAQLDLKSGPTRLSTADR